MTETHDPTASGPVRTGVAEVDAVLESLEDLAGRPVEEHPAAFEAAHDTLRRSLDHPDSTSSADSTG